MTALNQRKIDLLGQLIRTTENGASMEGFAEAEILRICEHLDLDEGIIQVAKAIYSRSLEQKFIQYRTFGEVIGASVYAACRIEKDVRNVKRIGYLAAVPPSSISQTHSEMSKALGLNAGPVDPTNFVPRLCKELALSEKTEVRAIEILNKTEELHSGKSPSGLAASAVYASSLLCNQKKTQQEVADAMQVSTSTIRAGYQEMIYHIGPNTGGGSQELFNFNRAHLMLMNPHLTPHPNTTLLVW